MINEVSLLRGINGYNRLNLNLYGHFRVGDCVLLKHVK